MSEREKNRRTPERLAQFSSQMIRAEEATTDNASVDYTST